MVMAPITPGVLVGVGHAALARHRDLGASPPEVRSVLLAAASPGHFTGSRQCFRRGNSSSDAAAAAAATAAAASTPGVGVNFRDNWLPTGVWHRVHPSSETAGTPKRATIAAADAADAGHLAAITTCVFCAARSPRVDGHRGGPSLALLSTRPALPGLHPTTGPGICR